MDPLNQNTSSTGENGGIPGLGGTSMSGSNANGANNYPGTPSSLAASPTGLGGFHNPAWSAFPGEGGTSVNPVWGSNGGAGSFTPKAGTPVNGPANPAPANSLEDAGPAIYGLQGNQTLGDWQKEQSTTFNNNQLAAQGQYNTALGQMPYNTQINNQGNPYDKYVANPASPGQASAAFQSPENAQAWQASGLNSSLANSNNSFAASRGQGSNYQDGQLNFLLNALQLHGPGGQNRFGNSFSPVFTGQGQQGGLSQNSQGQQQNSGGLNLSVLLPLLLGLAQRGPAAGSYGNLGVQSY